MSDDNVVVLDCDTRLDIPPERVLKAALEVEFDSVMVVGWQKNGRLYKATSTADAGAIVLLLECAKSDLLEQMKDTDG